MDWQLALVYIMRNLTLFDCNKVICVFMKTILCAKMLPEGNSLFGLDEMDAKYWKNVDALESVLALRAKLGCLYRRDGLIRPKIGSRDLYLGERLLKFGK